MDAVKNFGKVRVSTGYSATDTSIVLITGQGNLLPDPSADGSCNLIWWNNSDYNDPADDPYVEIIRLTARSGDTLTITRAQEGTVASLKNVSNVTYRMILGPTAKTITDIESGSEYWTNKTFDKLIALDSDADALILGTATAEGGDMNVYRDSSGNSQLTLDADASQNGVSLELYSGAKLGIFYFQERTAPPPNYTSWNSLFSKPDNVLYFQDGDGNIESIILSSELSTHMSDVTTHGITTGAIVGTLKQQKLDAKLISLNENIDDDHAEGIMITDTVGEDVLDGDLLYLDSTDTWKKADCSGNDCLPAWGLATQDKLNTEACNILLYGIYRSDTNYSFSGGKQLYLGSTSGSVTDTKPTLTAHYIQHVGFSTAANTIMFNPEYPDASGNSIISLINASSNSIDSDNITSTLTGKKYQLADVLDSDHTAEGKIINDTVGDSVVFGDVLYLNTSEQKWKKADANIASSAAMPAAAMAIATIADDASGELLVMGTARDDTWTWTGGQKIYVSTTAGGLTSTAPNTSGDTVQIVGIALDADTIIFNPDYTYIELS